MNPKEGTSRGDPNDCCATFMAPTTLVHASVEHGYCHTVPAATVSEHPCLQTKKKKKKIFKIINKLKINKPTKETSIFKESKTDCSFIYQASAASN